MVMKMNRNKSVIALLGAQFLSAFADNAVLFTVVAMAMKQVNSPGWYVPVLQASFLVAFVLLAPWVGHVADRYPKAHLLTIGNLIKATGTLLLLINLEPLLAYAIVGVGAAVYSPAKYGILPELTDPKQLVKINGWMEGATILAILAGMLVGAKVADYALSWALMGSAFLFFCSMLATLFLPKIAATHEAPALVLPDFFQSMKRLLVLPVTRFTIIGTALFWSTAAVLRVIIIAWAPLVFHLQSTSDIAQLTLFLAIGIMVGAAIVPHFITLDNLRAVRFPAYLMALMIIALGFVDQVNMARGMLFFVGIAGGLFIVPINAALQEAGHQSTGSGSAVALQNFFENLAMLILVGVYTYLSTIGLEPVTAIKILGGFTLLTTMLLVFCLPAIQYTN